MKVLIFGKSDIGEGIKQLYPDTVNVPKEECDVRDYNAICATLEKYKPDVIVNCAGISHVQVVKDSNIKIVSSKTSNLNQYSKFYEANSTKNDYKPDNQNIEVCLSHCEAYLQVGETKEKTEIFINRLLAKIKKRSTFCLFFIHIKKSCSTIMST